MENPEKSEATPVSFTETRCLDNEISQEKIELEKLGFSEPEIEELNMQLDGIIERGFDRYFSKLYE